MTETFEPFATRLSGAEIQARRLRFDVVQDVFAQDAPPDYEEAMATVPRLPTFVRLGVLSLVALTSSAMTIAATVAIVRVFVR
jgi:hypothetical protein